jgi:uncharacterized membrane protein YphA (DoxX/SURF4 family)
MFGMGHFMNASQMASFIPLPGAMMLNYLAGAGLVLAAIAILINKKARLASLYWHLSYCSSLSYCIYQK